MGERSARAGDQMALRRHNLSMVLRHLRDHGPRSRARLAAETGLNKATVSSLVAELTTRGLVRSGAVERGAIGRPGQIVELAGTAACAVGAEVNVDHVAVSVVDVRGEPVVERGVPLDASAVPAGEVLDHLTRELAGVLDEITAAGASCVGVTVGVAGLVDSRTGAVESAPNLGWSDVPVAQLLAERLGRPSYPVRVDNEASLAAIAEARSAGPDTPVTDLVVVVGGVGVGGGIVSHGQLLRGHQGFAGEIGHIRVDPNGRQCGCGRIGCWETVVGLRALLAAAADPDDQVHDPRLGIDERLAELDRRARLGDARTISALHEVGRGLGAGAAVLVDVLNPAAIVLGGYYATVAPWMLPAMEAELAAGAIAPRAGGCRVQVSRLGLGAVTRGAALVSLDAVFDDPTRIATAVPTRTVEPTGGVS
jgi:predicted NBD/HSP70 family sugar kinase